MTAEAPKSPDDNVTYIDEHRRERWLQRLETARQTGQIAVFNADLGRDAKVLPFPTPEDPEPAA